VVYRAESSQDGVRLEAAVKILRPGLDTGILRDRFNHERQILAGLDHPGIARFIDCGADGAGRSFLAMEYVHGEALGGYLTAQRGLRERVRLFEQVAEAVQYLHSRLVAHGDIKPANILKSEAGVPKLLDFGAARLLAPGMQPGELPRMMLTPEYASPSRSGAKGHRRPATFTRWGGCSRSGCPASLRRICGSSRGIARLRIRPAATARRRN
jgi:serine/threonine protein kinase